MAVNSEPLAVSAAEAAKMLGISKPKVYDLMSRDVFPSFKVGSRTLISVAGLRDWVQQQAQHREVRF